MAFGNNRGGKQGRAHFQLAGGSVIKFRHPYFAGQVDMGEGVTTPLDEIDISASVKLDGRYFEATQNQDSSKQVALIDGSVVTICNRLLNGTISIPAIRTTGLVGTGDVIAACQLIKSVGDTVGGILYKTDYISGKAITKLFYGVTVKSCPDDVSEGNDVAVSQIQLYYAGWIEAVSTSAAENKKRIWATGNAQGLSAYFSPYPLLNAGTGEDGLSASNNSLAGSDIGESDVNLVPNTEETDEIKSTQDTIYSTIVKGVEILTPPSPVEDESKPSNNDTTTN